MRVYIDTPNVWRIVKKKRVGNQGEIRRNDGRTDGRMDARKSKPNSMAFQFTLSLSLSLSLTFFYISFSITHTHIHTPCSLMHLLHTHTHTYTHNFAHLQCPPPSHVENSPRSIHSRNFWVIQNPVKFQNSKSKQFNLYGQFWSV